MKINKLTNKFPEEYEIRLNWCELGMILRIAEKSEFRLKGSTTPIFKDREVTDLVRRITFAMNDITGEEYEDTVEYQMTKALSDTREKKNESDS